ncbi:MaoC family dehydratase N-terminal domain-containing protein [Nocardioides sp.]|uniref:FAS1-like dehydratase domain-containing protein n=1 Tax=Nocardioides sp. TaxID=35761 RepID=UPI00271AD320|nr:MaoC family dehydratase N-terminal domain-containing protein [Nocardioides sp.]MDO9458283.1 MaoC family dehydratase N-terminal domain-containing protein [Nocardioides sp.]
MPVDPTIVGRTYPPAPPHEVTVDAVRAFVEATGASYDGGPAPATYPIVPAFSAMLTFLEAEALDLSRIDHGAQEFRHERPVVPGDVLTVALSVATLRTIGGNDIIGTTSAVTDADGALVCTGTATLVHRGPEDPEDGA